VQDAPTAAGLDARPFFTIHYSLLTYASARPHPQRQPARPPAPHAGHLHPHAPARTHRRRSHRGGTLTGGPTQRLLYVLEGTLSLSEPESASPHKLTAGSFAYCPEGHQHTLTADTKSRVALIEKPFQPLPIEHATLLGARGEKETPWFFTGHESDLAATPLNGDEALQVRALMPASLAFDFACNTMEYQPGAALSQVEVHYMEHGLLMLQGGGIYRLGDDWYPTQAGDFIWMAPFCPQWFGALGKAPAKYLIYKDFNRHTLA
jgi:(S)-ureidoglycine aminohydrolase